MCSLSVPTTILKTLETSSSIGMFARDTGGCLISRLGLSRSMDEAKEISFAEISESVLFFIFQHPLLQKQAQASLQNKPELKFLTNRQLRVSQQGFRMEQLLVEI